ncbi:MAG: ROK family protein [Alphaproteobacteria bacterium]|nr:ROK family protein [Alphaproteobacteria bacterium]MDE2111154.1 ROK family protein [Alphaproteobacteria bacterium]MDE2495972.1 ROK family protein [Alphaproteobacteria bacterium]
MQADSGDGAHVKHAKRILAIDIGGTGLKAAIIDAKGKLLSEHLRVLTPHPCPPALMVKTLRALVKPLKSFDCISIGFPGVVRGTHVLTAPHLGTDIWTGYDLAGHLSRKLGGKPVRLINDADMQGFAVIKGKGLELVVTLGTGFGTALFREGELMPHMEIAHMPAHNGKTFDDYLGDKVLKKVGAKKWSSRVSRMLPFLYTMLHYDHLYLGGGNAKKLVTALPPKTIIVSNIAGLKGGAGLWYSYR